MNLNKNIINQFRGNLITFTSPSPDGLSFLKSPTNS